MSVKLKDAELYLHVEYSDGLPQYFTITIQTALTSDK